MADENKIQLDVELSESSIDGSFQAIDDRATKSAKASAAVFGEYFQKQENDLKDSIDRIVGSTKKVAEKSAKESASAFEEAFKKQDDIYKASVKQNLDNAIKALSGGDGIKKSAAESASVFEEAFEKGLINNGGGIKDIFKDLIPDGIKNAFQVKSLADVAAGFYLIKQAAGVAKDAIEGTINAVLEGEQKIKLEKKFEVLATQAGIAADVLKDDLGRAVDGLVDDDAILQLASESFVQLGNNAKQLPAILELARKTYNVFGGDVVSNAEAINNAIFSGQTRQLKQLGILIDTEKVYKDFARSIGTVVPLLSEQQKQQALLNAVLEQGNERFKSVSAEGGKATDGITRLKVQVGELNDQLKVFSANTFAKSIAEATGAVTGFLKEINRANEFVNKPAESLEKINFQINYLTGSIKGAEEQLKNFNAVEKFFLGGDFEDSIKEKSAELVKYQKMLEEATKKQAATQAEAAKNAQASAGAGPNTNSDEFLRRKQELVAKVQGLNDQLNQSEIQVAQTVFQQQQNRANYEKLAYEQRKAEAEKFEQDKAALEKFYADNGIVNDQLRQQGREALESAHVNRLLQIQLQYEEQRKLLFDAATTQVLTVGEAFNNVTKGMEEASQELAVNAAKNFKNLGRAMISSVGQAAGNAFAAFGQAIATGENALEAFGKALLNSLGQAAIQMGTTFILQGIAYTYAGLANGPPLIAAGAALAVAGGILAASQGANSTGNLSGGGSASSGGGLDDANPITEAPKPEDTVAATPTTELNLTINGNVLDRRETGLEIATILQEQFQDQGLVIRGA